MTQPIFKWTHCHNACIKCLDCVDTCKALTLSNLQRITRDPKLCTMCETCSTLCDNIYTEFITEEWYLWLFVNGVENHSKKHTTDKCMEPMEYTSSTSLTTKEKA